MSMEKSECSENHNFTVYRISFVKILHMALIFQIVFLPLSKK